MGVIDNFDGEYRFLSNFYVVKVEYGGLVYTSSEAAFQAQKCLTKEERVQFTQLSPSKSKTLGRNVQLRPDWNDVRIGIMEDIVRCKFAQNPDLAKMLLETGDKTLIEGNTWHDTFWGVDSKSGYGKNNLGKILMKIREELRVESGVIS
ncbi:MAG: NADAR family protein [Clostridia bacterium]|nr:NADAR family protein [Clostridia bacterium]